MNHARQLSPQAGFASREGRLRPVDGLRGAAALLVILHHARLPWAKRGGVAVDLLFVLGGFLITLLLLQEWSRSGKVSLGRFYARRVLRLGPALLLLLACICLHAALFLPSDRARSTYLASAITLCYQSNWAEALGLCDLG